MKSMTAWILNSTTNKEEKELKNLLTVLESFYFEIANYQKFRQLKIFPSFSVISL